MSTLSYFLATLFGGFFGLHKFIDGKKKWGFIYLFTFGIFGIGWMVDIIFATKNLINSMSPVTEKNFDSSKILFEKEFLIVGVSYECRKNKSKQRSYVIKQTQLSTPVHIEKYIYDKAPAYMIVNSKIDLDLGVLSAGAASWLSDYYSKGKTFAQLTNRYNDSFHVKITVVEK